MANQIDLPDTPITFQDGRPQPWFAILLRRVSATVDGVLSFIGYVEGGSLTADNIEQGIEQKIREIARQEIAYNADGTVSQVIYKNPETLDVIAQEDFTYNTDKTVETVTEKDTKTTVVETFNYNGVEIDIVDVHVAIGGLF